MRNLIESTVWLDHPDFMIDIALSEYHGLNIQLINILFYGTSSEAIILNKNPKKYLSGYNERFNYIEFHTKNSNSASLPEVIELFQYVYSLIKYDQIIWN